MAEAAGISHALDANGIVRTTMRGIFTLADLVASIQAREASGLLGNAHVIDAREAEFQLTAQEVRTIAGFTRELQRRQPIGRTAFVAEEDLPYGLGRMYAAFDGRDTSAFGVFRTMNEAEEWILTPP
ncbi:MAG TPA: hypothetical protein VK012_06010 [Gemmatimonadales bacterium]|nr:hypothetical protein [Gemmatimonadales bacterium]